MKKWVLKAIIQKIISFLPYSNKINFWFQKNITKGVNLTDEHFNDKLIHCSDHINLYKKSKTNFDIDCFELGTGWYPVIPIGFFLVGAKSITSIDLTSLCNKERLIATIEKFKEWKQRGKLEFYIPNINSERWSFFEELDCNKNFEELLLLLKINLIVGDARKIKLQPNSIDYIFSNNVFEHIYEDVLGDILVEFKRLLKNNGIMSHFIDMSDHFAHNDASISIYNYLQFNDAQWTLIDNSVQPQNRMRLTEYIFLFDRLKFKYEFSNVRDGDPKLFEKVKLDKKYLEMNPKEVMISHVHAKLM